MDNITAVNMLKMGNMGVCLPDEVYETAIKALEEVQQYRAIGTVEECREAMEKQRAKEIIDEHFGKTCFAKSYKCPSCDNHLFGNNIPDYCSNCGQKFDVERDNE